MSDQTTVTPTEATQAPNTEAGQTVAATPEPAAQPFAVFNDAKTFNARVSREARKILNDKAKDAGFDDWQHMQDALGALRQAPAVAAAPESAAAPVTATPAVPAPPDEAARLRMALQVGTKLNLPTALVARLQGTTADEMEADAQGLLGLMTTPRGPGIPPVPQQNRPVTFTRTQLQDAAFVREHVKEIQQAGREGRIVDS